jgi:tetratricopeptide (TPR) repeat protein
MKTYCTILLLSLAGIWPAVAQSPDVEAEKAAILDVIKKQTDHYFTGDFEAYQDAWAHEPYVVRMGDNGSRTTGWDSVKVWYKNIMEQRAAAGVENHQHEIIDEQIHIQGNHAWVVHNQHNEGAYQGNPFSYDQWLFRNLERKDGQWKITYMMGGTLPSEDFTAMESEFNTLGYRLLAMDRTDEAIKLFKLNTEYYPESSNAFDSLGEAYMEAGDTELAVENYRKSLDLDPNNTNAKAMIDKLETDIQQNERPG